MIDDIKKSFNSILYERTTSPLFGTLIVSWSIWNWKIIYLTLFISEKKIDCDKITYIINNFSDVNDLITYPIVSAFLFLTFVPFISNAAYWSALIFDKWKKDKKKQIEMEQLLTLKQSIELREQISEQEIRFEKLLESKNDQIEHLNAVIENLNSVKTQSTVASPSNDSNINKIYEKDLTELSNKIKNTSGELEQYENLIHYMQNGYKLASNDDVSSKLISLLESYNIIENIGNGIFKFTDTGKKFNRLMNK